jgi:uroporphyrinogen decarboxylase
MPLMQTLGIRLYDIRALADLAQAKALIGDKGLTCRVIDDIKMMHWTTEQIRDAVRRICETGKQGGHCLFGTSMMLLAIPEQNIRALIDAAFEYGRLS